MSGKLSWRIVEQRAIGDGLRARMLELMYICYEAVESGRFYDDLAKKSHVLMLYDGDVVMGFSTILMVDQTMDGRAVRVLYSGDTVIHPSRWGTKALQHAFTAFVFREKLRHPFMPLYWLLLSKGYKTYLLLTNYFPVSFPRHDAQPTPAMRALRDGLARAWWGDEFDAATDILSFRVKRDRVKGGVAPIDDGVRARPDVAYFLQKNPGYVDGDELVCLALLDWGLPWRTMQRTLRARRRGATR